MKKHIQAFCLAVLTAFIILLPAATEAAEQTVHFARENSLHFFAAGHHATERHGIQALGAHLSEQTGLHCRFIDIDNPV